LHFITGIAGRELPVDGGMASVPVGLPGTDVALKQVGSWNASAKALARQDREFDFGHVKPTGMFGRELKLQLRKMRRGFGWSEGFIQGSWGMGVQVIQHKHNRWGGTDSVERQLRQYTEEAETIR
jgi:hypothetical protein